MEKNQLTKKLKHKLLKSLIIISGRIIELSFLKNVFKIILNSKKFTTIADVFLDRLIRFWIFLLYPNKGVLSEENIEQKNIGWIIDPLDGTRSYVNGFN